MSLISPSPYRRLFIFGLIVQVIAAWFSIGYHHPDEHFQILEFCNYKLGFSPASDLPWEFATKCRTAVLPFIIFIFAKPLLFLGLYNPFAIAFLLRLLMGIFTWVVSCILVKFLLPQFTTTTGKLVFILCTFFLWYVPYLGVRFSSENLAGLLFFLSVALLLKPASLPSKQKYAQLFIIGFLLCLSVFIRLQMAFAIAGLAAWVLFIRKVNLKEIGMLTTGGLLAIALCIGIDYWFYGTWTLTPYNYFNVNILQHAAANFGVFPWWYYLQLFLSYATVPLSVVLLLLFFAGLYKKPFHLLAIVCICFVVGHSLIAHKEMRFLFPINLAFIFVVCIAVDALIKRHGTKPIFIHTFRFLAAINIALLLFRTFVPAQEAFKYYRFIYNFTKGNNTQVYVLNESPYHLNNIEVNFYKPLQLQLIKLKSLDSIGDSMMSDKNPSLFFSKTLLPPTVLQQYKWQRVYCIFPEAILYFNINNWQERSNIWAIYKHQP